MKILLLSLLSLFLFTSCDIDEETRFGSISEEKEESVIRQPSKVAKKEVRKKSAYPSTVDLKVNAVLKQPQKTDKVDIVFYIDGFARSGKARGFKRCLTEFGESIYRSGFLYHINKTLDWQFSFTSFSKQAVERENLEWSKMFFTRRKEGTSTWETQNVLKKGENERFVYDHVVYHSLTPLSHNRYRLGFDQHETTRLSDVVYDAPKGSWKGRKDPLVGLDYFLSHKGNVRLDSKVIVFIIAHSDFPYSRNELKRFSDKHQGITFYALTAPEKKYRVPVLTQLAETSGGDWKSLCEESNIGSQITQSVLNSVK